MPQVNYIVQWKARHTQLAIVDNLHLFSFNLHGLNQGAALLEHWCTNQVFDILLVQEHWLAPANFSRLIKITPGYNCIVSSAMEQLCASTILRGRPFGGLAVILGHRFRNVTKTVLNTNRVIAVLVSDVLIMNIYLPCSTIRNYKELTLEIIANIL